MSFSTSFGAWRRALVALGAAAMLASVGLTPQPALAKEYNVAGTVDCGVRSGQRCPDSNAIRLWTSDISGVNELWTVDISWVKKQMSGGFHQDEAFDFEVMDSKDAVGGIQALSVHGEGNFVNRLNWGVREEYTTCNGSIRADVGRAKDDDEAMAGNGIKNCHDLRR